MPLFPLPVEQFGSLNLVEAPDETGFAAAIDLLNVDFDQRGALHSRNGYAKLTASAAATRYRALSPFATSSGTRQLIAARDAAIEALNTSGAVIATQATTASEITTSFARTAAPGSEHVYVASSGSAAATVYRWDGAAWSTPTWTGTTPTGRHLAVSSDFRLVNARRNGSAAGDNSSTVRFSDAGTPTTWGANNYVDVSPGDGEEIAALIRWRDLLFAFKGSRFALFYGTHVDASGNPVFDYRMIEGQGITTTNSVTSPFSSYRAVCATPNGVYFVNRRGIWLTTGGPAQLVSAAVDPIFRGQGASSFWQGSTLFYDNLYLSNLHWHDNRLYFAYASGTSAFNDKLLVHDPSAQTWTLWDIPCAGLTSFRAGSNDELVFSYATGTNDIGRHGPGYADDNGTAISWRYQSGFDNLAPPRRFAAHYLFGNTRKRFRKWKVTGSGNVTFGTAHDFGSVGTTSSLTLGTSPAIKDAWHNIASRGQLISYKLAGTSPFTVQKLTAYLAGSEPPLLGNPGDK